LLTIRRPRPGSTRRGAPANCLPDRLSGLVTYFSAVGESPHDTREQPYTLLNHCHSTIYMEGLAGDVGGLRTCQINDRSGDFGAGSEPSHRYGGEDRRFLFHIQRASHWTLYEPWRDAIYGHVAARHLGGKTLIHTNHSGLRGRIIALASIAGHPN